jgi:hypothetical protein
MLKDAFDKRIYEIVVEQKRAFSFDDFKDMNYGTFRNKISERNKQHLIEVAYTLKSKAYYTLNGIRFDKPKLMTHTYTVLDSCHPIQKILETMPMGQTAIHNIRLTFISKDIWMRMCRLGFEHFVNQSNKDICLPLWNIEGLTIRLKVHHSDTVSVAVGCSEEPVVANIHGLIRLTNALTRVEEHFSHILNECKLERNPVNSIQIPRIHDWVVKMWHIGSDSIAEYSKEKFHCSWQLAEGILVRIYSKQFKNHRVHVREEVQENPNKRWAEVADDIIDKLFQDGKLVGA